MVCCSLFGYDVPESPQTLRATWAPALETEYLAGSPEAGATPEQHDDFRGQERYRDVFAKFSAAWNWDRAGAAPRLDADGEYQDDGADYQPDIRRTLTWTPLKQGFDYSQDPAVD